MNRLVRVWNRFEEGAIAFLLAAMLVTFLYVVMTRTSSPCSTTSATACRQLRAPLYSVGDAILGAAGHVLEQRADQGAVRLADLPRHRLRRTHRRPPRVDSGAPGAASLQRLIGILACLCCLGYAGLFMVASYDWVVKTLLVAGIGAGDLDHFGILQAYIAVVVPVGFGLVLLRYLEIPSTCCAVASSLGLADEAAEAFQTGRRRGRGEPSMTVLILFLLLFLFMFIGVPIAISLGLSGARRSCCSARIRCACWRSSCSRPPRPTPSWRSRSSCSPARAP